MKKNTNKELDVKSKLRRIPEFKGVVFWDITPILKDKRLFKEIIKCLADHYRGKKIDVVVADIQFCALTAYRNQKKGLIAGQSALSFEPLGIAMAEDTLLINWVQNFMSQFRGTGELKKVNDKWFNIGSWIDELP